MFVNAGSFAARRSTTTLYGLGGSRVQTHAEHVGDAVRTKRAIRSIAAEEHLARHSLTENTCPSCSRMPSRKILPR